VREVIYARIAQDGIVIDSKPDPICEVVVTCDDGLNQFHLASAK
jgi:hypothetical protein